MAKPCAPKGHHYREIILLQLDSEDLYIRVVMRLSEAHGGHIPVPKACPKTSIGKLVFTFLVDGFCCFIYQLRA